MKERLTDGTLKPFLISFATSYVVGLGVNLMLTWRVWAKRSMIDELGGAWVPLVLLITSALLVYLLLTVLAVSLAQQPRFRRRLLREMVDYKAAKATTSAAPATEPAEVAAPPITGSTDSRLRGAGLTGPGPTSAGLTGTGLTGTGSPGDQ